MKTAAAMARVATLVVPLLAVATSEAIPTSASINALRGAERQVDRSGSALTRRFLGNWDNSSDSHSMDSRDNQSRDSDNGDSRDSNDRKYRKKKHKRRKKSSSDSEDSRDRTESNDCKDDNGSDSGCGGGGGGGPSPLPPPSDICLPSAPYPEPESNQVELMTIPTSCTDSLPNIRWAGDTGLGGRLYMNGTGCATMTDLYQTRVENDSWTSKGPIYVLDDDNEVVITPTAFTGKWLLTSELFVVLDAVFYCRGTSIGGDCDELRIESTGSTDFHEIRGHGGSLYFENTVVTSWDTPNKQPQEEYKGGRSFLNCVSESESGETCIGQPKHDYGECRMDIINSEMGYLGYFDSESYGLTWKVRGFCADKTNPEVFDNVNVYGDIKNSDIHHMYYGMYSYGHQGGVWTDNLMHDNHQYGFDPHDDSDYLTIAGNTVYNNVNHGIIASKRCNNVQIFRNEVYNGGAQATGIFLHRSSDSCKVYCNNVHDMQDAGLAILESFDASIYYNTFTNVKYGIRISLGGGNNDVRNNVFDTCSNYGLYTYRGSDDPEETTDGRPGENTFRDNEILNTATGVKIKRADNTIIRGNLFTGTELLEFNDAQATFWMDNETPSTACTKNISGTQETGETIPESTFTSTEGIPVSCYD